MKRLWKKHAFLLALALAAASLPAFAAPDPAANQLFLSDNAKKPGVTVLPSGLQYRVLHAGFGQRVGVRDTVQVQYSGSLANGPVFDGTSPGLPATLAVGTLIRGLGEALQLMHVGDRWQIVIPPSLGFGAKGSGTLIPPDAVLVFDVTLMADSTPSNPTLTDPGISVSPMTHRDGNIREQGAILSIPQ